MTPFPPLSFIIHNSTNYLRLTYLLILSALFKLAARLYHYLPLTQQITTGKHYAFGVIFLYKTIHLHLDNFDSEIILQ